MIDFIKIIIKDLTPAILEANPLLDFYDTVNLTTGELKTTNRHGNKVTPSKNATYNGLGYKIYDTGLITISGSLHKYRNKGAHNYNDFNSEAISEVLQDLKTKFNINPGQCILKCLEIGINITPPISTNDILDNCFLHKTKPFEYQKNSDEGRYKQVQHSQYIIKIYNKALHYKSKGFKVEGEIMRFEIKYIKMEKLNRNGIFSLQDLINYGLHNFKDDLLKEWQNVLFYDNTIQIDPLSAKLQKAILEYSNPNYWTGLQTKNFRYHKNQYDSIVRNNSENVKGHITQIISKKIDFLNNKTIQIDRLNELPKQVVFSDKKEIKRISSKNTKAIQIDPLTILSKRIVSVVRKDELQRVCKVTGLNIEMQKKDSVLLSHTGLKYYYETDRKIFEQIKRRYLSREWINSDYKTQIKEIAHNIRNTDSNQRIKRNKLYQPNQTTLWDGVCA